MLDIVNLRQTRRCHLERFGERCAHVTHFLRVPESVAQERQLRSIREGKLRLARDVGTRVSTDRHMRDVPATNSSVLETSRDRQRRKSRPVLHSPEALLLERDHELAILEKNGGNVTVICVDTQNVHMIQSSA